MTPASVDPAETITPADTTVSAAPSTPLDPLANPAETLVDQLAAPAETPFDPLAAPADAPVDPSLSAA